MSILETKNVSKQYPGTLALDNVTVSFESGKVHAFIGKNGSGKSTLVNVFSGSTAATSGKVFLDGKELQFRSPSEAQACGLATVYQELSLVPNISVAENIFLGRLPMKNGRVDWKKTYAEAENLLKEIGIDIPVKEQISRLSIWQCQMIEIAKAMSLNPKVLMLDEPTSSLAQHEVEALFRIIRKLKEKDVIIIYITHKLQELWQIADTCTVLRDGKLIGIRNIHELDRRELLKMMFGEVTVKSMPEDLKCSPNVVLNVDHLSDGRRFQDVSFELHEGEVLGIAGMLGSGRTELLSCIFGSRKSTEGSVELKGKIYEKRSPEIMNKAGMAMIQEDRKRLGINLSGSIAQNLCYAALNRIGKGINIDRKIERKMIEKQVSDLQIKVADTSYPISVLSGGNQQKVAVGNWLNIDPEVMIFDEPSKGIDVNAKQQIFQIIWDQSRKGVSSILVSTELEELLETCHRILIMRNGKITKEVDPKQMTVEDLYAVCMGEE